MKRLLGVSPTSCIIRVALYDSPSTTGAVLTGVVFDMQGLTIAITVDGQGGATALTIENITTIGTYEEPTSSAHCRFKPVDTENMTGLYEIHLHNDTIASITGFIIKISGATNLAPCFLEVQTTGDAFAVVNDGAHGNAALKALIDDIPKVSEFEARSLLSDDYVVVEDLGVVQTADHTAAIATLDGKVDTIDGIVDAILADTGTDGVVVAPGSKTGYALSATGADLVTCDVATVGAAPTTLINKIQAIWNRLFTNKSVTAILETAKEKDNVTTMETWTLSDDDTTAQRSV